MTLTLAVETSSLTYEVALCTEDGSIVARDSISLRDARFHSIGHLVESLLHGVGRDFTDVQRLAVDVGPGNVISVRAGISYVNGLAYSLGRPVHAVDSLTLLAAETGAAGQVLCVRQAAGGNVNAALFRDGVRVGGRHGKPAEVVAVLLDGLEEVTVAGVHRTTVADLAPGVRVHDSGIELPTVSTLCRVASADDPGSAGEFATPITDATSYATSVHPL